MATITDFIISVIFITSCCILAQVARKVINGLSSIHGLVKELIMEAIAAAELCSTCFELIIVADNFGVATYAIVLFVLTLWWCQVWDNATACPYTHIEDMIEGNTSPKDMALKIWAQLMGGCCVWRFIQFFWWLELTQTHKGKAFEDCTADLQVSPLAGALIEGIATLLCRLVSKTLSEKSPKHATILDSFVGTSLVVAAFNFSGGYFNPVLATGLKWGCAGHSEIEHFIVYWFGSCAGAILSIPVYKSPIFRQLFHGEEKIKDE